MTEKRQNDSCFYDTNVLAAFMLSEEGRLEAARMVLRKCSVRGISILSIHELLVVAERRSAGNRFAEAKQLVEKAFGVHGVSQEVAIRAAMLRLEHGLPEVDAIILASAVVNGYKEFYSFDADFQRLNGRVIDSTKVVYRGI